MKEIVLIQLNQMTAERSATNRIQLPKKYVPNTNTTGSVPSSALPPNKPRTVDPAHVYDRLTANNNSSSSGGVRFR